MRQADPDRKRDRHPRDVDRGHQKDIGQIEDHAAEQRPARVLDAGLAQIVKEASSVRACAAESQREEKRQEQHTQSVVPVEELKPPLFSRQFLGIGPGPPAQHC